MISRNTLISLMVLLAGLITGLFAYHLSGRLPFFTIQEEKPAFWSVPGPVYDTSDQTFHGSSLELSQLYYNSRDEFQEVLEDGVRHIKEIHVRRDLLQNQKDTMLTPDEDLDRQIAELEYSMDLHRLMDYYTHYFMHYYRWIDTGDRSSSVKYKLAMGQFWATVEYHRSKYPETSDPPGVMLDELLRGTRMAEQTDRAVRWAKVLVVILLFLMVMGIPRFIRDRGYRKFAASLYFDALFRPHMISDMNAWHSASRMVLALVLLYLFGGVILSSFNSWLLPVVLGTLGLIPVLFLLFLIDNNRRSAEVLISLMAPKLLLLISVLAVMAVRGPMFFWYHMWTSLIFRAVFLAILGMLIFRKFHVHVVLVRKWSHRNRRASAAMVGMAAGLQCLVISLLLFGFGPAPGIQALNSDLQLWPSACPEGKDLFTCLALPADLPVLLLILAGTILIISIFVFVFHPKKKDPSSMFRKA